MILVSSKTTRRAATMTAALAVALTTIVGGSYSPAYAHSRSSAVYYGCGSGFNIASDGIRKVTWGDVWGEVILTYNASTGENCVVTRKIKYHGDATLTGAYLMIKGEEPSWRRDTGYFSHWAAVTAYARGKCVKYYGIVTSRHKGEIRYVTAEGGRTSWGNCG